MSFWRRLMGKESRETLQPQRLDYLNEGLALERQGDYEAALTSYRLAYRDNPSDARILLNMAIACTKTGQPEEGIEVHLVPRRYLAEWARNRGSLIDVKIWAGLHFLT